MQFYERYRVTASTLSSPRPFQVDIVNQCINNITKMDCVPKIPINKLLRKKALELSVSRGFH